MFQKNIKILTCLMFLSSPFLLLADEVVPTTTPLDCRCKDWGCDENGLFSCADRNPPETFCAGVDNPEIGTCCKEGEVCQGGICQDTCANVSCRDDQYCQNGACQDIDCPDGTIKCGVHCCSAGLECVSGICTVPNEDGGNNNNGGGGNGGCVSDGEYSSVSWGNGFILNGTDVIPKEGKEDEFILTSKPISKKPLSTPAVTYAAVKPPANNECCDEDANLSQTQLYDYNNQKIEKNIEKYVDAVYCCESDKERYEFIDSKSISQNSYYWMKANDKGNFDRDKKKIYHEVIKLFGKKQYVNAVYVLAYNPEKDKIYKYSGDKKSTCCSTLPKMVYTRVSNKNKELLCCEPNDNKVIRDLLTKVVDGKELGVCCEKYDPETGEVNTDDVSKNTASATPLYNISSEKLECCNGEVYTDFDGEEKCCNGEVYTDISGYKECCPIDSDVIDENYCCDIIDKNTGETYRVKNKNAVPLNAYDVFSWPYYDDPEHFECCYPVVSTKVPYGDGTNEVCCPNLNSSYASFIDDMKTTYGDEIEKNDVKPFAADEFGCCYNGTMHSFKDEDNDFETVYRCCPKVDVLAQDSPPDRSPKNWQYDGWQAVGIDTQGFCCYGRIFDYKDGKTRCCEFSDSNKKEGNDDYLLRERGLQPTAVDWEGECCYASFYKDEDGDNVCCSRYDYIPKTCDGQDDLSRAKYGLWPETLDYSDDDVEYGCCDGTWKEFEVSDFPSGVVHDEWVCEVNGETCVQDKYTEVGVGAYYDYICYNPECEVLLDRGDCYYTVGGKVKLSKGTTYWISAGEFGGGSCLTTSDCSNDYYPCSGPFIAE